MRAIERKLISGPGLADRWKISTARVRQLVAENAGTFPTPLSVIGGARDKVWDLADIEKWEPAYLRRREEWRSTRPWLLATVDSPE